MEILALQKEQLDLEITPQWTGNPPSNYYLVSCDDAGGNNEISLVVATNGNLQIKGDFASAEFGAMGAVSGTKMELELNYDVPNNIARLFKNGTQLGPDIVLSGTRSAQDSIRVGTLDAGVTPMNALFDDIVFYDEMQHITDYTPNPTWSDVPFTVYSKDNPSISTILDPVIYLDSLSNFLADLSASGSDSVRFVLLISDVRKYWTGSAWETANGTFSQTNTASEILANVASLDLSGNGYFNVEAFLHSNDGFTTPSLTSTTIEYEPGLSPVIPTLVDINGFYFRGHAGDSSRTIKYRPYQKGFRNEGITYIYDWKDFDNEVSSNGYVDQDIPKNPAGTFWEFKIGKTKIIFSLEDITDASVDFADLTVIFL